MAKQEIPKVLHLNRNSADSAAVFHIKKNYDLSQHINLTYTNLQKASLPHVNSPYANL